MLEASRAAAAAVGKLLYVGEYGGPQPNFTGPTAAAQAFPEALLRWQVGASKRTAAAPAPKPPEGSPAPAPTPTEATPERRSRVLSSIWSWECPSHRGTMNCVYPSGGLARGGGGKGGGGGSVSLAATASPTAAERAWRPSPLPGQKSRKPAEAGSDRMLALLQWAERRLAPGYCSSSAGRRKRGYCSAMKINGSGVASAVPASRVVGSFQRDWGPFQHANLDIAG